MNSTIYKYRIMGLINSQAEVLGEYATEQRCLEIIDEIQELLMGSQRLVFKDLDVTGAEMECLKPFKGVMYKVGNEPQITVNQLNTVVYEMPQE